MKLQESWIDLFYEKKNYKKLKRALDSFDIDLSTRDECESNTKLEALVEEVEPKNPVFKCYAQIIPLIDWHTLSVGIPENKYKVITCNKSSFISNKEYAVLVWHKRDLYPEYQRYKKLTLEGTIQESS